MNEMDRGRAGGQAGGRTGGRVTIVIYESYMREGGGGGYMR